MKKKMSNRALLPGKRDKAAGAATVCGCCPLPLWVWLLGLLALATLAGLLLVGLLLNSRIESNYNELKTIHAHLESDVMDLLMMQNLAFQTRFIQNGTVEMGFPLVSGSAPQSTSDFSDYVTLNYTLKEVLLTPASIPLVVLELSRTPRAIQFNGYTPPPALPRNNDLYVELALWSPGIDQLDSLAQNFELLPYSYITASKIQLNPACTCHRPSGFSPFFASSRPSYNSFYLFPNNLPTSGSVVMQFLYGQLTYTSLVDQYNFVGSSVQLTDSVQLLLPVA